MPNEDPPQIAAHIARNPSAGRPRLTHSAESSVRHVPLRPVGCLFSAVAVLATHAAAALPVERAACHASTLSEDRLDTLGPRGELIMVSGLRAILAGVHWPEAEPEASEAAAWLERFRGRPLTLSTFGESDRWGRARIEAVADPDAESDEPADLAGGLIAAGLAQTDAGESDALCRTDLLALENAPRGAGLGVWRKAVLDARDGATLRGLEGRFIVAEGRIVGVGERSDRTYLDFVRNSREGLSVTVTKRTWKIMRERGLTAATLKGRFARVRGRVEVRRGPTLDIASADMIEVPEGERAQSR